MVYLHSSCEFYHKLAIIIVNLLLVLLADVYVIGCTESYHKDVGQQCHQTHVPRDKILPRVA